MIHSDTWPVSFLRLKREGILHHAYVSSGFLHPAVEDWVLINAPGTTTAWQLN
ncbi:hypothetical protein NFC81_00710 [Salinispirillum sp. LH 10-3-1]|uniref:Uncharacterized protein n=1 Tax=Salinispirillum sp. LH 10-3-1 TaxID=2952525 RepID=A0AB38YGG6_9GAMM